MREVRMRQEVGVAECNLIGLRAVRRRSELEDQTRVAVIDETDPLEPTD